MPRSRSYSRDRDRSRSYSRSRSRSRTPEDSDRERDRERDKTKDRDRDRHRDRHLPYDAPQISKADYFQKSDEFRLWLKEEKGKYFDELSGDKARSYFSKFVKSWNKGKLPKHLYAGIDTSAISATSQTAYKWSFASKSTKADADALRRTRESVNAATNNREERELIDLLPSTSTGRTGPSGSSTSGGGGGSSSGRMQGPTLPSSADMQLAKEYATEMQEEERKLKRKRDRKEEKERVEDMVGPKEVGREGMLEKKRARRENDKAFRERGDEGLELDESTLMGGGDSFKAAIARREASKKRYEQKNEEKTTAMRERATAFREKESATMAMFQELAKQRFG
ncbi:hypothetical protein K435DRAFT_688969 [Dendrothele bispora CBS 962.96]|uniref:Splicing arginine serine-rich 12 n=1 Tax=Dendrothele bispora (strain CBS 962.96) TaxID=1314807 RepID=A0A4S8L585_DENBC|nr:hypothetical protein K435DRAFT_688969 [Dendrothele bispora CBS 962.96]